jgi:hypothetical protein
MVGRRGEELRRVDLLFIKNLWRKSEGDEPFRVDGFVHSHELRRLADVIGKSCQFQTDKKYKDDNEKHSSEGENSGTIFIVLNN